MGKPTEEKKDENLSSKDEVVLSDEQILAQKRAWEEKQRELLKGVKSSDDQPSKIRIVYFFAIVTVLFLVAVIFIIGYTLSPDRNPNIVTINIPQYDFCTIEVADNSSIEMVKGSAFTFRVIPKEGYNKTDFLVSFKGAMLREEDGKYKISAFYGTEEEILEVVLNI